MLRGLVVSLEQFETLRGRTFMNRIPHLVAPALVFLAALSASAPAQAQDDAPARPLPPPPPPPVSAQTPNGEYVAPLSQQTQQTYVPQSVAISGPRTIKDWNDGDPIPPGYHAAQRTRTGLIVGGSLMFALPYLFSTLVAAGYSDANGGSGGDNALYLPGVGPLIQMTNTSSALGNVVLAMDGALQCGGIAMLIYGIANPKTVLVRNDLATAPVVMPIRMGKDGYGVGLVAHF
jgi:hypothetical protein